MDEVVFDVIMQSTGAFVGDIRNYQTEPPPEEDLELGLNCWVGHPPLGISPDVIFDACSPAGYNFHPFRQFGCRYAFCRKVEPGHTDYYRWDTDGWLRRILFLSRLIRPTTIGTNLSARLYFRDAELQTIVPGPTQGFGTHAWVVATSRWRDWLSVQEFERLRDSIPIYNLNPPDRVRQARKHIDNAFHSFYLDQRCASIVTAFESLLKVSSFKATRQFASRVPKLAERAGLEITEPEAIALYADRSAFVHGTQVSFMDLSDELIAHYNRFEEVLRCCLLRASTEPAFAALFSSDETVVDAFGM
ncbi:MAG TPA: hypothetical protein VN788_02220 [Verrucomicrobiae bacterium]|nr:hypothetical protein [Verrucomicrobiae bacterium]